MWYDYQETEKDGLRLGKNPNSPGWLECYLGAKVEDLTPKTKLQSYYEHDYESFLAVLKRNGKKLSVDPARRKESEDLRTEFEGSMSKLLPLRERIRQTDELIDATVYRLYGLKEEEIEIVEAGSPGKCAGESL